MEKIDLHSFKFKRNKDKENSACYSIISYFKDKNIEEKTSKELMVSILEQIAEARDISSSTEETEEHCMLDRTQKYLKIIIDKLKYMDLEDLKVNTFNDYIQYIEKIAQDANEKQIKNRLNFFINELKNRYALFVSKNK